MFPTPPGPFPTYYDIGLQAALGVLNWLIRSSKYEAKQKIPLACKTRLVNANIYIVSASGGSTPQVILSDKGIHVMDSAPNESKWFTRFTNGLRSRIFERRKQDMEIYIALMIEM